MAIRKIIEIDEDICNGCGNCIPNCPEGALQVIDEKARLISDLFCDGLGACIGECPAGAIKVVEREAEPYSETKVMENIARQGKNVIDAHLKHLKNHGETGLYNEALEYLKNNNIEITEDAKMDNKNSENEERLPCGCPGSAVMDLREEESSEDTRSGGSVPKNNSKTAKIAELLGQLTSKESKLRQWPIQIMLVPPTAPYLKGAELLIAADCVPFAYAGFHEDFLEDKALLIGCPKLDDSEFYVEKFTEIFKLNDVKSVTVAHMEVPCCFGMLSIVKQAAKDSGKNIPVKAVNIGIRGNIISED
ncbi:MAG: 4Fe-4S binding protein [Actinobacteria bacterium]|nr:4Fe-4S binding protein [Actinomycetota bacterium]MCL5069862.1 4Fe-4S binding protein [Actinomycetota bacterium]